MTGDVQVAVGTQRLIRHRWTESGLMPILTTSVMRAPVAPVSTRSRDPRTPVRPAVLGTNVIAVAVSDHPAGRRARAAPPAFGTGQPGTGEHRIDDCSTRLSAGAIKIRNCGIESLSTEIEGHFSCVDSQNSRSLRRVTEWTRHAFDAPRVASDVPGTLLDRSLPVQPCRSPLHALCIVTSAECRRVYNVAIAGARGSAASGEAV